MRVRGCVVALLGLAPCAGSRAQSVQLTALQGALPVPVAQPFPLGLQYGLAGLWDDPTSAPGAVGAFFSVQQSSFSGAKSFQGVVAFQFGPRWSLTFGQVGIGDVFDSSLTAADPSLSSLETQAVLVGSDVTIPLGRLLLSGGVSYAGDQNAGDIRSSTLGRVQIRTSVFSSGWLSLRGNAETQIGGSIRRGSAKVGADILVSPHVSDRLAFAASVGVSRGDLWRYAETSDGFGAGGEITIMSVLSLSAGYGIYSTTFGAGAHQPFFAVGTGLAVGRVHLGFRYVDTQLGLGAGYGFSLGFER